jgi:hypothetical protein
MSRKIAGISLLAAGTLIMFAGGGSIIWGVSKMVDSFKALATVESPATANIHVTEPGPVTVWHDHRTVIGGRTVNHPESLPSGFTFELIDPVSGPLAFSSTSGNATMTVGNTSRVAVGSFTVQAAGDYEFRVSGPEPRVVSVTQGGSMAGFGGFFGGMFGGILAGLLGFGLLIAGVVVLLTGKPKPPPPPAMI